MQPRAFALVWLLAPLPALAQLAPPLETDPNGRRAIRGGPVEQQPNESPELGELRRFEERTFPRANAFPPAPPEGAQVAPGAASPDADREEGEKAATEPPRAHAAPAGKAGPGEGGLDSAFL